MTRKQMAKHLRERIRFERIPARVRMTPGHVGSIQVYNTVHDVPFTPHEQRTIRHIAKCNRLTLAAGLPIDVEQMTNPRTFEFYPSTPWE